MSQRSREQSETSLQSFAAETLPQANRKLRHADPAAIIDWSIETSRALAEESRQTAGRLGHLPPIMMTTSMGVNAAVMLHAVTSRLPNIPVVWVDTGFNLADTYRVAHQLEHDLNLNLRVYSPRMTPERIRTLMGGVPLTTDEEQHRRFTELVKLEPFDRAIQELQPRVWLTGIRREETAYRRGLECVTYDSRGLIKVAPFFHATEADLEAYRRRYSLPTTKHYFDPTKVDASRECGLHTASSAA